jgi:Iap family predicted aminopeptidase
MRHALASLVLCLAVCFVGPLHADDLTSRIRASDAMLHDLRELCDRVGGRPTGSPNGARAEEWAAAKLREAGVDSVKLEAYTLATYWESQSATASCVSPASFPLRVAAAPSTVGGNVEGVLVDFGDGTPETLAKVPESKGKIAFVHTAYMASLDDLFGDYVRILPLLDAAKRTGVKAMLLESSQHRSLLYRHPMALSGGVVDLPTAVVAHDQAERLARLMQQGEVVVRLQLDNRITGPVVAHNVVGEIRGTDKANEIVLFGAHLDSWDLGTGAQDNGVNAATVIDIARQLKAAGLKPRRTLRFVLFTGEENGMIGSREYAKAHASELSRMALMMTADIGSGKITGAFLNGREELRAGVEAALAPFIAVKDQQNVPDGIDGTDNYDFLLYGVPNVVLNQEAAPYLPDYHAESDTFDKVDAAAAKENEAIDAALLWGFANSETRARQQTRAEVEKLLDDAHVAEQMKAFGQWAEWLAGKRGLGK